MPKEILDFVFVPPGFGDPFQSRLPAKESGINWRSFKNAREKGTLEFIPFKQEKVSFDKIEYQGMLFQKGSLDISKIDANSLTPFWKQEGVVNGELRVCQWQERAGVVIPKELDTFYYTTSESISFYFQRILLQTLGIKSR